MGKMPPAQSYTPSFCAFFLPYQGEISHACCSLVSVQRCDMGEEGGARQCDVPGAPKLSTSHFDVGFPFLFSKKKEL